MGLKKLLKTLKRVLDAEGNTKNKQIKAVEKLLVKLEKKKKKFKAKLALSKSNKETIKISRHLEVSTAQLAKGRKVLKNLQHKMKSDEL